MIFSDPTYQIHSGEVFVESRCMHHEHALAGFLHSLLEQLGYKSVDHTMRRWRKPNQQVVVVLADDFGLARENAYGSATNWFDSNTVVITDNHMPHAVNYKILQLPISYFGVFYYQPQNSYYDPQHRFNLCINRMDSQRILFLLEFLQMFSDTNHDAINFNGWDANGNNESKSDVETNFEKYFKHLPVDLQHKHSTGAKNLQGLVPWKNHDMTLEQSHVSAHVNLIVETYAGNASLAFSEKIFRGLVTPAPWTLFSARGAVSYLRSLGFDVLDDLVDHGYDDCFQTSTAVEKIKRFLECSHTTCANVQSHSVDWTRERCTGAALHNQNLLAQFRQKWPTDFAAWLNTAIDFLQ